MTSSIMQKALKRVQSQPHTDPFISDVMLRKRWRAIRQHFTKPVYTLFESNGYLNVNNEFYILRKKLKMRLKSRLDWVYYNPADLANAIQTNTVEDYYLAQLSDPQSDPNVWKDSVEELNLKTHYATRAGRLLDSTDNL